GDLSSRLVPTGRQGEMVAEQFVGAVDQVDLHAGSSSSGMGGCPEAYRSPPTPPVPSGTAGPLRHRPSPEPARPPSPPVAADRGRNGAMPPLPSRPAPLPFDDRLRDRLQENLARHERRITPPDDRRRAAVAIVVGDSEVGEDRVDPAPWEPGAMDVVPG